MGELEGAVADGDGGSGGVVVVVVRRRALRGGLALPGRISPDNLRAGLTGQRRQRRAASVTKPKKAGQLLNPSGCTSQFTVSVSFLLTGNQFIAEIRVLLWCF
jgi:hypothetical protein